MDKRQVIQAYRKGFMTIHECAQILGVKSNHLQGMVNDPQLAELPSHLEKRHPVNS